MCFHYQKTIFSRAKYRNNVLLHFENRSTDVDPAENYFSDINKYISGWPGLTDISAETKSLEARTSEDFFKF